MTFSGRSCFDCSGTGGICWDCGVYGTPGDSCSSCEREYVECETCTGTGVAPNEEEPAEGEKEDRYREHATSQSKYDQMVKAIGNCGDEEQAKAMTVGFIMDKTYPREDIALAIKRVEKDKGWTL